MSTIPVLAGAVVAMLLTAGCLAGEPVGPGTSAPTSPYVDQQHNSIRGLSADEIHELRTGAGMGMARPAELNGFPGPLHVLELADELALTDDQRAAVQAVRERMLDEAVPLGEEILEAHAALEASFRDRSIDADSLRMRLDRIARLYEDLRYVHLAAHLDTTPLLSEEQNARYNELRGYDTTSDASTRDDDGTGHDGGHAAHGG